MNSTLRRTGIAAIALSTTLAIAGCGSSNSSDTAADPAASGDTSSAPAGAEAQTFGAGCTAVPKTGAGSFNGMATPPGAPPPPANPGLPTPGTAGQKGRPVAPPQ